MSKAYENLLAVHQAITQLDTIVGTADPASGISFMVRRGVARDNEANFDDETKRPWVTAEISDLKVASRAVHLIRTELHVQRGYWTKAVLREIEEAKAALVYVGAPEVQSRELVILNKMAASIERALLVIDDERRKRPDPAWDSIARDFAGVLAEADPKA